MWVVKHEAREPERCLPIGKFTNEGTADGGKVKVSVISKTRNVSSKLQCWYGWSLDRRFHTLRTWGVPVKKGTVLGSVQTRVGA